MNIRDLEVLDEKNKTQKLEVNDIWVSNSGLIFLDFKNPSSEKEQYGLFR
jgi:hypothetical protein